VSLDYSPIAVEKTLSDEADAAGIPRRPRAACLCKFQPQQGLVLPVRKKVSHGVRVITLYQSPNMDGRREARHSKF